MKQPAEKVVSVPKQRIERRLDKFEPFIDMSDWERRPVDQARVAFLSRALAAYCVQILSGTTLEVAAHSVTDTFHDRGIDAIYYDPRASRLLVVQSKWSDKLVWREAGEFCDGVRKLVAEDWPAFSNHERIKRRVPELETALHACASILLVTVCVGPQEKADKPALRRVDEVAAEIDNGADIAKSQHWHQKDLLDALKREVDPPKINADLYLSQYGEVSEPYRAIYGRVQAQEIVTLCRNYPHLAHSNLRKYFNRADVNSAIARTVQTEPEHFWYFNNGLTIICDSFRPGIAGRLKRDEGLYHLEGMSLVNGAQTAGILTDWLGTIPQDARNKIWIQMRAIAIGGCPAGFETQITKYTNLQNAVTAQDFAALDPVQSRLASDFAIEGRQYVFKWGEPDPPLGCTLKEATLALACANPDVWFSVQAKREISVLWDTESERYRKLFNDELTATRVWNAVCIMREVDATIAALGRTSNLSKASAIAAHMQRIILHLVFQSDALKGWESAKDPHAMVNAAGEQCHEEFERVHDYAVQRHSGEYLASLCKNFARCAEMVCRLTSGEEQPGLFDEHLSTSKPRRRKRKA